MRQGFKGVQTLPRQLSYDRSTKTVRAYPIAEIAKLRGRQVGDGRGGRGAAQLSSDSLLRMYCTACHHIPPSSPSYT